MAWQPTLVGTIEQLARALSEAPRVETFVNTLRERAVALFDAEEAAVAIAGTGGAAKVHARDSDSRPAMSAPLVGATGTLGTLVVTGRPAQTWDQRQHTEVATLARISADCLAIASDLEDSRRTTAQLTRALARRVVIEQAKGVLMARHRVDATAAFELLRGYARDRNLVVADVASTLLEEAIGS